MPRTRPNRFCVVLTLASCLVATSRSSNADDAIHDLRVGVATSEITPDANYPISGYYFERLATGAKDPLHAKAIVFRQGETAAALVVCDLIAIATDLTAAVRRGIAERVGIRPDHVILSATHTHTGPDYGKELFAVSTGRSIDSGTSPRKPYVAGMVDAIVSAVAQAHETTRPVEILAGSAEQATPISFHRRFLMDDGTVRTWANWKDPHALHPAGPIDPEVGIVAFRDLGTNAATNNKPNLVAILSSFALHLDTVGGTEYSADYPFFIERSLQQEFGGSTVSIFGTGCCGNINHANPRGGDRLTAQTIGSALGQTITTAVPKFVPSNNPYLQVKRAVVQVPLQSSTAEQLTAAKNLIHDVKSGQKPEFLKHVEAHKRIILEHLRRPVDADEWMSLVGWGLSNTLAGCGETIPLDVQVVTLGRSIAIVALPGEIFVELGLAIKNASSFETTLVIELANNSECIYVPTRYSYIGGGYEVVNSTLAPGGGELLAEQAIRLLAECAASIPQQ